MNERELLAEISMKLDHLIVFGLLSEEEKESIRKDAKGDFQEMLKFVRSIMKPGSR